MFNFLEDPNSQEYKTAVKVARIILAAFAAICLFIVFYFGGENIKSEESYLKAEVEARSTTLQQRTTTKDLQKWYEDQQALK